MDHFGRKLNEYKANLHTHSTTSDGRFPPQEVVRLYAEGGYDVLAFTDHKRANRISELDGMGMTLISGMELHPAGPRGIRWHLLGLGVPEDFAYPEPQTGQEAVDAVNAAGGIVFCAHPYWCGFTSAEVGALKGILGIEVYNTSTRYIGKEFSMQIWDELLDAGHRYTALAVDDMHWEHDLFKGFTVILAEDKSPPALLDALKNGRFYSSQGPRFTRIALENNVLIADFTPAVSAIAVRKQSGGYCAAIEDALGPGSDNPEISHLECDLSPFSGNYVRIQLRDRAGRLAWSNPVFIP